MDFRIHLLSCALCGLAAPAWAQQATPIRAGAPRTNLDRSPAHQVQVPLDPDRTLPPSLARLPGGAAAALYAPRLRDLLEDLGDATELAATLEPRLAERSSLEIVAELLWGSGLGLGWQGKARPLARLSTPEGLAEIGLAPDAPATVTFAPELGVAVVQLGLADRPRWERWLDTVGGADRARVEVGGEQASVIAPDSDMPVTCIARSAELTCQLGAGTDGAPLGPLETITSGRGPRLDAVRGLGRAFGALPTGARLYAVLNTPPMAARLGGPAEAHEDRTQRFARPEDRRRAAAEAQAIRRKVEHVAAKVEGTALGLYRNEDGISVRLEGALSDFGAKLLKPHLRLYGEHTLVSRWAHTPALMQFILRTHPNTTQRFLEAMNLDLPATALTGDLALLTLGVDAECPMAKSKRAKKLAPHLSWAFLLPSAAAVGLAGASTVKDTRARVAAQLDAEPDPEDARIRGTLGGSPYEIDVLDHVMLVAAGHGAGAAALRRLNTSPPRVARKQPPLLEASVDLHAIDAAFGSGSFGTEHRPELLALEALRLRLAPLLDHVSTLGLTVEAKDQGHRLSAKLSTHH